MPPSSIPGNRNFGLEGAGKGDAERSTNWRQGIGDINWPGVKGLLKIGPNRYRKVYRQGQQEFPAEWSVPPCHPND